MNKEISQTTLKSKKPDILIRFRKSIPVYMLILPSTALLLIFHYLPIFGISIAFQDYSVYKGVFGSTWVGIKYFERFLTDANFWRVMRNTIIINVYDLIFGFPVPIIFALFLNELRSNKLKRVAQTISYLPHFISWVVVAGMVVTILSPSTGLINIMLKNIFNTEPIHFLAKPQYFRSILVTADIWKHFGMSAVYYIAALSSIDMELYAAASIDGAGRLRQTWHITLPGLRLIIIVLLVLKMGKMINIGFEKVFLLYNPILYEVGDVISTYTYRLGIEKNQYSLTSAIGLTQSVINFILVFSANKLSRKIAGWSLW
ncbi:MAG TPA: ABC transporter permease subunit [Clostridiales bacterium]|nr:ABC transporter permease subunit [Clostridiales bacterium]